jgi:hypothetical protein
MPSASRAPDGSSAVRAMPIRGSGAEGDVNHVIKHVNDNGVKFTGQNLRGDDVFSSRTISTRAAAASRVDFRSAATRFAEVAFRTRPEQKLNSTMSNSSSSSAGNVDLNANYDNVMVNNMVNNRCSDGSVTNSVTNTGRNGNPKLAVPNNSANTSNSAISAVSTGMPWMPFAGLPLVGVLFGESREGCSWTSTTSQDEYGDDVSRMAQTILHSCIATR